MYIEIVKTNIGYILAEKRDKIYYNLLTNEKITPTKVLVDFEEVEADYNKERFAMLKDDAAIKNFEALFEKKQI